MASVFDIARKCHSDGVELDAVKSSEGFYRKLGMTELANRRFHGNVRLAVELKSKSALGFQSAEPN